MHRAGFADPTQEHALAYASNSHALTSTSLVQLPLKNAARTRICIRRLSNRKCDLTNLPSQEMPSLSLPWRSALSINGTAIRHLRFWKKKAVAREPVSRLRAANGELRLLNCCCGVLFRMRETAIDVAREPQSNDIPWRTDT